MILVQGLSVTHTTGRKVLCDVRFEITPGQRVGLMGPNGAGKTTLFLTLAGILKPTSGTVQVAGLNPHAKESRKTLPAKLGVLFQDADDQIFNPTVLDDIAFGPLNLGLSKADTLTRCQEAMRQTNLAGFEDRVPHRLSGGEKRRVALAGLLAMHPEVLLLDEPSQHLDPRGRRELVGLLCGLPQTMLIASHDLRFVEDTCESCIVLDGGKVVATGLTCDILRRCDLLEKHGLA